MNKAISIKVFSFVMLQAIFFSSASSRSAENQFEIPKAVIVNDKLVFSNVRDMKKAFVSGIFLLRRPSHINIFQARTFAKDILNPDSSYRKIGRIGLLEGYIELEENQQTKLAIQTKRWKHYYPPEIVKYGTQLDGIVKLIMKAVFKNAHIPQHHWNKVSSGYMNGLGTSFFELCVLRYLKI